MGQHSALAVAITLCLACEGPPDADPRPEPPAVAARSGSPAVMAPKAVPPRPVDTVSYPWLTSAKADLPPAVDDLESRFPTQQGYRRAAVSPGSFGAWLRNLPLAAPGTPVRRFDGSVLHPGNHENIAAVVALDIGSQDLQQCADVIIRLHAEHKWSRGDRDQSYRAAAGLMLPYQRYSRGERIRSSGASIRWQGRARPDSGRGAFRDYLSTVFAWTNTVALRRQTSAVEPADLRPGDFFIQGGNPGHAVLVLDVAIAEDGSRRMLLGQSFMPAQSFQILRPQRGSAWYSATPGQGVKTPFWRAFQWSDLHRFAQPSSG